jgi:hypothetical protein
MLTRGVVHPKPTPRHRILKGENAADPPVMQATKVELAITLKAAKVLSLVYPSHCSAARTTLISNGGRKPTTTNSDHRAFANGYINLPEAYSTGVITV